MKKNTQLAEIRREFAARANRKKAARAMSFFKTKKGEYGAGDFFLGLTVPETRFLAKKYQDVHLREVEHLLRIGEHEERLCALFILVHQFKNGTPEIRRRICDIYLKNTKHINNWDLVDASAHYILGAYLEGKSKTVLHRLARSKKLWEKRIAMVATWHDIQHGSSKEAYAIANILMRDTHDLIHKAIGWMLREAGKRVSKEELRRYIQKNAPRMPRTALRYAIEHFPERERKKFLALK